MSRSTEESYYWILGERSPLAGTRACKGAGQNWSTPPGRPTFFRNKGLPKKCRRNLWTVLVRTVTRGWLSVVDTQVRPKWMVCVRVPYSLREYLRTVLSSSNLNASLFRLQLDILRKSVESIGPTTLLLLLFASTKFCDLAIVTILRVLIFAISWSQAKFCEITKPKLNFKINRRRKFGNL